jgi:hypothetical protein
MAVYRSAATFTGTPAPELGTGGTRLVLDCPHRTTTLALIAAGAHIPEMDLLRLALVRHDAEEGCACTAPLWQRCAVAEARL